MPFGLGVPELLIILVVVLIFFGAGKLPEVGRTLGSGIRNFQKSVRGEDEESPDALPPGDAAKGLPRAESKEKHTLPADISAEG
jgi:sec-independent protein translocase protein TatA